MCQAWERREMHANFWKGSLKEVDHFEDTDLAGKVILKYILMKEYGAAWSGFIWFRIRTSGWLL
jgi:hypothetical protein